MKRNKKKEINNALEIRKKKNGNYKTCILLINDQNNKCLSNKDLNHSSSSLLSIKHLKLNTMIHK